MYDVFHLGQYLIVLGAIVGLIMYRDMVRSAYLRHPLETFESYRIRMQSTRSKLYGFVKFLAGLIVFTALCMGFSYLHAPLLVGVSIVSFIYMSSCRMYYRRRYRRRIGRGI